jgi:16S rRNA (cytosine1402-N4)-methyltransferase
VKEIEVHVPVLVEEMLEALDPRPDGVYLDGTLGDGGYAAAILEASDPEGIVVGLDLDSTAIERSLQRLTRFGTRFRAQHGGYQDARTILHSLGFTSVDGAVLDLGLSSAQLEDPERGFSFQLPGPLDMRFDTTSGLTAREYLQNLSVRRLEEILATYGEERYCKKLARGIIQARDAGALNTTEDLARLVTRLKRGRREKIHPATRTFQALRIAVNKELENLEIALNEIPELLKPGGRFCVISYHSLEDRLVKRSFRQRTKNSEAWVSFTPKPVRPSFQELRKNPRARSARMRVLEASYGDAKTIPF